MMKMYMSIMVCALLLIFLVVLVIYFSRRSKLVMRQAHEIFCANGLKPNGESKYLDFDLCFGDFDGFYCGESDPVWYFACLKETAGGGFQKYCWCSISPSRSADILLISDAFKLYHPVLSKTKGGGRDYGELCQSFRVLKSTDKKKIVQLRKSIKTDNISVEINSGMLLCMFYVEKFSEENFKEFTFTRKETESAFG